MQKRRTQWHWLIGCAVLVLFASGCFQPAGSNPQALSVAQSGATFTPNPTDLPPPTLTPETIIVTATQDPFAQPPVQDFSTIPTQDLSLIVQPTQDLSFVQQPLDELDMTATFIVQSATDAAALQITQTACALGLCAPTAGPTLAPPIAATQGPVVLGTDCIHEVAAGENLYRIGIRYGVDQNEIARLSGITNANMIFVGQKLTIPGCGTTGSVPPATTIPTAGPGGVIVPTTAPVTSPATGGSTYTVQQGDTLFKISLQTGVPVVSIAAANGITDINLIVINQQLVIPPG